MYYADPSGYYRNCVKEAYDRIRQENPDMPAQEAHRLALAETGKASVIDNILRKPVTEWTDSDLQRAVDSIHNAQFNGAWWGNLSPMAVTIDSQGRVVVTRNNGPIRENSRAGQMARQIFGPDVEFPTGRGSNYPRLFGDSTNRHAETRGIQAYIGGDTSRVFADGEIRQACSHYACGNPNPITGYGCAQKINRHNVNNITGFEYQMGHIGRTYSSDLWELE